ncbi:hypothetical protein ACH42_00670 [Endozoicomonas sp. (ex Bugula neritina AB1)]|nr:hypothetical protein ACH42_00670 [Endozoicomonas sp. (ex Bugula neritina AB1)]
MESRLETPSQTSTDSSSDSSVPLSFRGLFIPLDREPERPTSSASQEEVTEENRDPVEKPDETGFQEGSSPQSTNTPGDNHPETSQTPIPRRRFNIARVPGDNNENSTPLSQTRSPADRSLSEMSALLNENDERPDRGEEEEATEQTTTFIEIETLFDNLLDEFDEKESEPNRDEISDEPDAPLSVPNRPIAICPDCLANTHPPLFPTRRSNDFLESSLATEAEEQVTTEEIASLFNELLESDLFNDSRPSSPSAVPTPREFFRQNIINEIARNRGVVDPTDRSSPFFQILIENVVSDFLIGHRRWVSQPRLETLLRFIRYHRYDPDSMDNVELVCTQIEKMLKEAESTNKNLKKDKRYQKYRKVLSLLCRSIKLSFYKTQELDLRNKLKKTFRDLHRPGAESLIRLQASLFAGGGVTTGAAATTLSALLALTVHEWTVVTDTEKTLHQRKRGMIAGVSLNLSALAGRVKVTVDNNTFIGSFDGEVFNSFEDFIEYYWSHPMLEIHHNNFRKKLSHLFHRLTTELNPQHQTLAGDIVQLEALLKELDLIDPQTIFQYEKPKATDISLTRIKRRAVETQFGVRGKFKVVEPISAGADLDLIIQVWRNKYLRSTCLRASIDESPEALGGLVSDFNIRITLFDIPGPIRNYLQEHYPKEFASLQENDHGYLCAGPLLQLLKLIPTARQQQDEDEQESIEPPKDVEPSEQTHASQLLLSLREFYLHLIEKNFSQFQAAARILWTDKKNADLKKLYKERGVKSEGQLQRNMALTFMWLLKHYEALKGSSLDDREEKRLRHISDLIFSNYLHLPTEKYEKYLREQHKKEGKTTWITGSFRLQFLFFEVMAFVRSIEDVNHFNEDSEGKYVMVTFRFSAAGNMNLDGSTLEAQDLGGFINDFLANHVTGASITDISMGPDFIGVRGEVRKDFKIELFFALVNGKPVLQYVRLYEGHREKLAFGVGTSSASGVKAGFNLAGDSLHYRVIKDEIWGDDTLTYFYGRFNGLMMRNNDEDLDQFFANKWHQRYMAKMMINIMTPGKNIRDEYLMRINQVYTPGIEDVEGTLKLNQPDCDAETANQTEYLQQTYDDLESSMSALLKLKEKYDQYASEGHSAAIDKLLKTSEFSKAITAFQFLAAHYHGYYVRQQMNGFQSEPLSKRG